MVKPIFSVDPKSFFARMTGGSMTTVVSDCYRLDEMLVESNKSCHRQSHLGGLKCMGQTIPEVVIFGCHENLAFTGKTPKSG
jgi:hypothetical protein